MEEMRPPAAGTERMSDTEFESLGNQAAGYIEPETAMRLYAEARRAREENTALRQANAELNAERTDAQLLRDCEKAEAEIARLRASLTFIAEGVDIECVPGQDDPRDAAELMRDEARAALGKEGA